MTVPPRPKIFHIVHVDRLQSIIKDRCLWCDETAGKRPLPGTTIGIRKIKERRLSNGLSSRPGLRVGSCVPFYFCPRSVMLNAIHHVNNPDLAYKGGQERIIHLVADLRRTVKWAEKERLQWAFTLSNAGAAHFEDRCRLEDLRDIDWEAVTAWYWSDPPRLKEHKQAEFLVESRFPWELIDHVGVKTEAIQQEAASILSAFLSADDRQPSVQVEKDWYY